MRLIMKLYHDKMLAELAPVGAVEFMLAERVVSLWWRLRRAERMQNQAIDEMIEHKIDNPLSKSLNMINLHAKGIPLGDPRYVTSHLQLGRIASTDWSNCRVLERMMMYERQIENSTLKIMKELKRFQILLRIEMQDANQQHKPSPSLRDEAATRSIPVRAIPSTALRTGPIPINDNRDEAAAPKAETHVDLKKQSQFAADQNDAKSFMKGDYSNKPAGGDEENKAKFKQIDRLLSLLEERLP
jgi:hypothetical protein